MPNHDVLLDYVFEPIARWTTDRFGIGCFVLASIFFVAALILLMISGEKWHNTGQDADALFIVFLGITAVLSVVTVSQVIYLEKLNHTRGVLDPVGFRSSVFLYRSRLFGPIAVILLTLRLFFEKPTSYELLLVLSIFSLLLGVNFVSCTRDPPSKKPPLKTYGS